MALGQVCRQCGFRWVPTLQRLVDYEEGRPPPSVRERWAWPTGDVLAREGAVEYHLCEVYADEDAGELLEEPAEPV